MHSEKENKLINDKTDWLKKYIHEGHSKCSKPHPERSVIADPFCCGNTLPILIKLEKLSQILVLISMQMRPKQWWDVCDKSKIWVRIRTFWMTHYIYIYIYIYVCVCEGGCMCVCVCMHAQWHAEILNTCDF